ncbi:MAG: DNA-binding protein Alba, partial [Promethearchaeia archaeon]
EERSKTYDENAVYIGKKPTMKYVMAALTVLKKDENCTVKARGRAISQAVDVCEILRHRFMEGVEYEDIIITTEKLESNSGEIHNVSSMELVLSPP